MTVAQCLEGRAFVFGDNVDTDVLAPGIYMKDPIEVIASHCLESLDPSFASAIRPGDIVVAGAGLGIGSSREQAAEALKYLGAGALLAKSYGGIFYRNALNFGLPALVCAQTDRIGAGDRLRVDPAAGRIENLSKGENYSADPLPQFLLNMIADGGLVTHLEKRFARERSERA
ncbi:MAG: 3-isopropylmalate dehydratase small subunit [Hyphomicrobiales bacterium]|nr:3-isopropylmalate dehydratase small subunit [Hyphomicrobiales bacterium]